MVAGGLLAALLTPAGCSRIGPDARTAAPPGEAGPAGSLHARAALLAEPGVIVPGAIDTLGIAFSIDPGWHLYGNACNDTGFPVAVTPDLPSGFEALPLLWPAPRRLISPGDILDHVYEDRVTLLLPVRVPADAAPNSRITLRARVEWLVCRQACIPESSTVSLELPVAGRTDAPAAGAPGASQRFAEARAQLPRPPETGRFTARRQGGVWEIAVPGAARIAFYPAADCPPLADPLHDAAATGGRLTLHLVPGRETAPVDGVLQAWNGSGQDLALYDLHLGAR